MHRNKKCYFNDNNKSVYCPRIKKLYTLPETNKKKLKKNLKLKHSSQQYQLNGIASGYFGM